MKAILCYERAFKGNPFKGQPVLRAAGRRAHTQDLPRTEPFAIEVVLKFRKIRRPSKIGIRPGWPSHEGL